MISLLKPSGRCRTQFVCVGFVVGLTIPPFLFILHELVNGYQTQPNTTHQWEVPLIVRQDHGTAWREALMKELKSGLINEIHDSRKDGILSCEDIDTIDMKERLGRGITKDVYRGVYRGRSVAMKMVTDKVEDIKACWRRNKYKSKSECYVYANYKLMKELALSIQLDHPNVIKSLGMCIRNNDTTMGSHGVITVYEIGDKTAGSLLRRLPWDQRLDMSIEIADLLDYLEHSPLGSLALWDFKTRQFTLVKGRITLIDLDDVSAQEVPCEKNQDCNVEADTQTGRANIVNSSSGLVPCVNSTCYGLSAKFNVISATRGLLGESLLSSPPPFVQHLIESILSRATQGNMSASQLKESLRQLMFAKPKKRSNWNH